MASKPKKQKVSQGSSQKHSRYDLKMDTLGDRNANRKKWIHGWLEFNRKARQMFFKPITSDKSSIDLELMEASNVELLVSKIGLQGLKAVRLATQCIPIH